MYLAEQLSLISCWQYTRDNLAMQQIPKFPKTSLCKKKRYFTLSKKINTFLRKKNQGLSWCTGSSAMTLWVPEKRMIYTHGYSDPTCFFGLNINLCAVCNIKSLKIHNLIISTCNTVQITTSLWPANQFATILIWRVAYVTSNLFSFKF